MYVFHIDKKKGCHINATQKLLSLMLLHKKKTSKQVRESEFLKNARHPDCSCNKCCCNAGRVFLVVVVVTVVFLWF